MKCTKAIIPVAGYGTRRLPITKAVEKAMLPILNRPVIDYVVEDCLKAGITDIYFVISSGATQIRDYFEKNDQLDKYLRTNGKAELADSIAPPQQTRFHFVEQDTSAGMPHGTAIPVWLCREFIQPDEYVLVLMGDDFIYNTDGSSEVARLLEEVKAAGGGSAMLGVEIERSQVSKYGVLATHNEAGHLAFDHVQEKPAVEDAQSNLINVSKFLFEGSFFDYIEQNVQRTVKGEYYITDSLNDYVADGHKLYVVPAKGAYLDSGTVDSWLAANNFVFQATSQ